MKRGSDAFPRGNEALSGVALLLNVAGGEGGPESGADAANAAAHAMVPRVRSAESTGASYSRAIAPAYPPEPGSLRHIAAGGGEQSPHKMARALPDPGRDPTNRTPWTPEEDIAIHRGVNELGLRWRQIAARLPGRSDDAVRNRWNRLQQTVRMNPLDPYGGAMAYAGYPGWTFPGYPPPAPGYAPHPAAYAQHAQQAHAHWILQQQQQQHAQQQAQAAHQAAQAQAQQAQAAQQQQLQLRGPQHHAPPHHAQLHDSSSPQPTIPPPPTQQHAPQTAEQQHAAAHQYYVALLAAQQQQQQQQQPPPGGADPRAHHAQQAAQQQAAEAAHTALRAAQHPPRAHAAAVVGEPPSTTAVPITLQALSAARVGHAVAGVRSPPPQAAAAAAAAGWPFTGDNVPQPFPAAVATAAPAVSAQRPAPFTSRYSLPGPAAQRATEMRAAAHGTPPTDVVPEGQRPAAPAPVPVAAARAISAADAAAEAIAQVAALGQGEAFCRVGSDLSAKTEIAGPGEAGSLSGGASVDASPEAPVLVAPACGAAAGWVSRPAAAAVPAPPAAERPPAAEGTPTPTPGSPRMTVPPPPIS